MRLATFASETWFRFINTSESMYQYLNVWLQILKFPVFFFSCAYRRKCQMFPLEKKHNMCRCICDNEGALNPFFLTFHACKESNQRSDYEHNKWQASIPFDRKGRLVGESRSTVAVIAVKHTNQTRTHTPTTHKLPQHTTNIHNTHQQHTNTHRHSKHDTEKQDTDRQTVV